MPFLPAILPAIIGGAASIGSAAFASSGQRSAQQTAQRQLDIENRIRQQILDLIKPFATQLLQFGINPADIVKSPLGQAILSLGRQGISGEFEQSRQNLADQLASMGISGGMAGGPMANLFSQEALAQSNLLSSMPQIGIDLGIQGANLLNQQQAQFNPNNSAALLAQLQSQSNPWANAIASIGAIIQNQITQSRSPVSSPAPPSSTALLTGGAPSVFTGNTTPSTWNASPWPPWMQPQPQPAIVRPPG